jgi:histone-lysine N-methyltransferase SETMAR
VPKLLSEDQKQERVRTCKEFVAAVHRRSMAMLDCIVTMDEAMVSYHTSETKKQSKQWIEKGQPGPIKARVHASRTKQMLLVFFDNKGLNYTNIVPRGSMVNANYILKALGTFMKHLKKKRPEMVSKEWFFHWDNAPVHTAAVFQTWLASNNIQLLQHPPYSLDLAPVDFFFLGG